QGVLTKPFDMSNRDYLDKTPQFPWTLQLSIPRFGGLSKQWIIPGGMGVTDKKGNFLGTITLGFTLDGLNRKIAQVLSPADIHYLVLTDDFTPILDSAADNSGPNSRFS